MLKPLSVIGIVVILAGGAFAAAEGTALKPKEEPVTCPKCNGTGGVMIPCTSCGRSGKPGYINLGDRLAMCERCQGKGEVLGCSCWFCNGTKKVLLSALMPWQGGTKEAPRPFKWCPSCKGSGVADWLPCHQCKRSKWPGYVQMGMGLTVCNRCHGTTQLPGLACKECGGKGMVEDKDRDHAIVGKSDNAK